MCRASKPTTTSDRRRGRCTMFTSLRTTRPTGRRCARSSTTTSPLSTTGRCRCSPSEERSEEHTSELQSRVDLVCRLLLEKKKQKIIYHLYQKQKKKKYKDPNYN